jgi:aryl-alcohol dehydrogenase-like predicted oxidoreductase
MSTLPYRRLPNGKLISGIGLGCSSFWAKPAFPEESAVALVRRAYALGVNHFDTGPSYAAGGAEKRLAQAVRQLQRDQLVISTKAGTYVDGSGTQYRSFEPSRIRAEVHSSLERLGLKHVDILYLHGPAPHDLSSPVLDCLIGLKESGLISYSGVNSFEPAVLKKLVGLPIDAVMPQYSIFDVSCAQEVAALAQDGKIIVSGTALGQGIVNFRSLIPSNRKSLWYLLRALKNDPLLPLTRLQAQRRISALGRPALEAAFLFLVKTPGIISAVFGTTSIPHLEANAAAAARIAEVAAQT